MEGESATRWACLSFCVSTKTALANSSVLSRISAEIDTIKLIPSVGNFGFAGRLDFLDLANSHLDGRGKGNNSAVLTLVP
jgi:hypothetical protein